MSSKQINIYRNNCFELTTTLAWIVFNILKRTHGLTSKSTTDCIVSYYILFIRLSLILMWKLFDN